MLPFSVSIFVSIFSKKVSSKQKKCFPQRKTFFYAKSPETVDNTRKTANHNGLTAFLFWQREKDSNLMKKAPNMA